MYPPLSPAGIQELEKLPAQININQFPKDSEEATHVLIESILAGKYIGLNEEELSNILELSSEKIKLLAAAIRGNLINQEKNQENPNEKILTIQGAQILRALLFNEIVRELHQQGEDQGWFSKPWCSPWSNGTPLEVTQLGAAGLSLLLHDLRQKAVSKKPLQA